MAEETQEVGQAPEVIWWMCSVDIVYRKGGLEKLRPVNVLFHTTGPFINERILGNVNVAAQKQAVEQKKLPEGAVIVDAVNRGISMLGVMTVEQFQGRNQESNAQAQ